MNITSKHMKRVKYISLIYLKAYNIILLELKGFGPLKSSNQGRIVQQLNSPYIYMVMKPVFMSPTKFGYFAEYCFHLRSLFLIYQGALTIFVSTLFWKRWIISTLVCLVQPQSWIPLVQIEVFVCISKAYFVLKRKNFFLSSITFYSLFQVVLSSS